MPQINQALTFEIVVFGLDGAVRGDVSFDAAVIYDIDGSSVLASSPTLFTYISASGVWRYTLSSGSNDAVGRYLARVDVTDDSNVAGSLVKYDYVDVGDVVVANVTQWLGQAVQAAVNGFPAVDVRYLLGTLFSEGAAGRLVAGIKQFFNVATPTSTMNQVTLVDTTTALTNAATNGDLTATMKLSVNSEVDTALADYDAPTHTEMTNELAALNNFDPAADTVAHVTLVDTTTNLTNAPTAGDFTSTMKTSIGTALTGYGAATATNVAAVTTNVLAKLLKYVQLILRGDAGIATDNATEVTAINANGGSGAGGFDNTTDSQQAIAEAGVTVDLTAVTDVTDKLNTALESDGAGGYQFTTLGLENAPGSSGGACDEEVIANDVAALLIAAGTTLEIVSLVGADGTIRVRHGDAYNDDNDNGMLPITANLSGVDITTFDAGSIEFSVRRAADKDSDTPVINVIEADGIVRSSATQIRVPLTSEQMKSVHTGTSYVADVQGTQNGDTLNKVTFYFGTFAVVPDVTP